MSQNFRLDKGGLINRDKKISFKFNGKSYFGYDGDTLSSLMEKVILVMMEIHLRQP